MTERTSNKLKAKQVANLSEPGTYEDGNGLRLVIKNTGRKYWVIRFQLDGRRREMGLGSYPDKSLADARSDAAEVRRKVGSGIDPIEESKALEQIRRMEAQREAARKVTFAETAAEYIESHRAGWKNAKHIYQWESTISTYANPHIGLKSPADITTADVLKVLKPIWEKKPETASRVRNRIELVLDAAKAKGLRDGENPARWRGHLDKLLPRRNKVQAVKHYPALPWAELPAFMESLREKEGLTYRAMEMTILTACRTSEVLSAKWDEVDLEGRTWTIPAERMKMSKEHRVPLSGALIKILKSLPRMDGNPHLFPGMKRGKPLSNMAMLMGRKRQSNPTLALIPQVA